MLFLASDFCSKSAGVWQLVGKVLVVFKIAIPLLLIIFGMVDLGKAVIGSKEDDIKKATNSLIRRAIAAIVIFFIPTIVGAIFGLVSGFSENEDDYKVCENCLVHPYKSEGDNACQCAKDSSAEGC